MRINEELLDNISQYSVVTGITNSELVTNLLVDFFKDKYVYNDYLPYGVTVNLPRTTKAKKYYLSHKHILNSLRNSIIMNIYPEEVEVLTIEIKNVPNNLDVFKDETFQSSKDDLIHEGIEFFVDEDWYEFNTHDGALEKDFLLNSLYCLYFKVEEDNEVSVQLIDYLEAINRLDGKDNETKDKLISCINSLKRSSKIDPDDSRFIVKVSGRLEKIAKDYNTGNIIEFGSDIEKRYVLENYQTEEEVNEKIQYLIELYKKTDEYNQILEDVELRAKEMENWLDAVDTIDLKKAVENMGKSDKKEE